MGCGSPDSSEVMRIIAGSLRSRQFHAVAEGTRPTSDRTREGVFSAIAVRRDFNGARVLDLYAGSGASALEAISRGASFALSIDAAKQAVAAVRANRDGLGVGEQAHAILCARIENWNSWGAQGLAAFDLIFADPPYADAAKALEVLEAIAESSICAEDALFVFEYPKSAVLPPARRLKRVRELTYGDSVVALCERA